MLSLSGQRVFLGDQAPIGYSGGIVPEWFSSLQVIRLADTLKPKAACGRKDAYLPDA